MDSAVTRLRRQMAAAGSSAEAGVTAGDGGVRRGARAGTQEARGTGRRGRAKGAEVASGGRPLLPVPEIPEGGCGRGGPPGGRATGVRGLGGSQPTASRSPSDASFSWFVVSFVCFMLFNTCYFWILRTAYTALSLSLSPHPRPCPGGHASQQGNPPCPPPERQSRPSRVDGVPCGNGERGPRRGWSSLSLSRDPGRTGLGDRAGVGCRLGRPPGAAGCPPVPAVSVGTEPRGLGWGRGAASKGPGVPRQAGEQTAPPLGLHAACSRPAAPAGARRDAV